MLSFMHKYEMRISLIAAAFALLMLVSQAEAQRTEGGTGRPAQPELPTLELKGQDRFEVVSKSLVPGLYQVDYGAKHDTLFVTSAFGRQVAQSELVKVDPKTLEILARVKLERTPDNDEGVVYAAYGIGVDDENGTVWVTNTRVGSVAVYSQSDLSLIKQFERGNGRSSARCHRRHEARQGLRFGP